MARQYPLLNVIGLGAQDSVEQALGFVSATGTGGGEITMVWDPSFESWRSFGVRSQPYWLLYDAEANLVESRPGAVDLQAVEAVLSS